MRSDRLKQVMQQIDPNFDERNAGFNRFSKFVIEAGQKGVILLTKLDNGQYEVAPGPAAKAGAVTPVARPRSPAEAGREEHAPSGARGREEGSRRGRSRRGRGGRDRSGGRDAAHRDRNGTPREASAQRSPVREDRLDTVLTLARAFQLMAQALSEFRSPVGQEALRLRMVAMHGREDPLLDAGRFPRLLRQANDAEVADVRKVGDDDYEITAQRQPARLALPPAPQQEESPPAPPAAEAIPETSGSAGRENGQRLGLRFRRGSRGPARAGEIPLIGMVQIESASEPAESVLGQPSAEIAETVEEPRRRPRRPPRKRVADPAVATSDEPAAEVAPPKRPRARSRKKPE
jgi:hypothetical protein